MLIKSDSNQNTNHGSTTNNRGGNSSTNLLSPHNSKGVISPPTMTLSSTNEKNGNREGGHGRTSVDSELKPPILSASNGSGSFGGGLQYLQNKRNSAKDTNIRLTENHNTNHVV